MAGVQLHLMMVGLSLGLSVAVLVMGLRDRDLPEPLRWLVVLVAIAGGAYSLLAGGISVQWPFAVRATLRYVAAMGVVGLWHLVRLVFDDRRKWGSFWALAGGMALAAVASMFPLPRSAGMSISQLLVAAVALALSVHVLWMLVVGHAADLDTGRRTTRLWWAAASACYILYVVVLNLSGAAKTAPLAHALGLLVGQIALKLAWLVTMTGNPSPLARLAQAAQAPPDGATKSRPEPVSDALVKIQAAQVLDAIRNGQLYRRPRLSVQELADHVRLSDHRLRVVINDHLGYRNFNAFLNHFRLQEAAERLRSPQEAHLPVLTIALSAGFGSIGPFNRAFRDAFGLTPTEYRRTKQAGLAENTKNLAEI